MSYPIYCRILSSYFVDENKFAAFQVQIDLTVLVINMHFITQHSRQNNLYNQETHNTGLVSSVWFDGYKWMIFRENTTDEKDGDG